jgi:ERCC4-type nuclease
MVDQPTPTDEPKIPQIGTTRPIVINIKKKKKRRYSRGLGDIQKSVRGMTKISTRMSRSMSKGMEKFQKASDKSSLKKRDGALRDLGLNIGKAMSKSLDESSRLPFDIAKALNTGTMKRSRRRGIRMVSRFNRLLRIR